jgi:hypothetical protein
VNRPSASGGSQARVSRQHALARNACSIGTSSSRPVHCAPGTQSSRCRRGTLSCRRSRGRPRRLRTGTAEGTQQQRAPPKRLRRPTCLRCAAAPQTWPRARCRCRRRGRRPPKSSTNKQVGALRRPCRGRTVRQSERWHDPRGEQAVHRGVDVGRRGGGRGYGLKDHQGDSPTWRAPEVVREIACAVAPTLSGGAGAVRGEWQPSQGTSAPLQRKKPPRRHRHSRKTVMRGQLRSGPPAAGEGRRWMGEARRGSRRGGENVPDASCTLSFLWRQRDSRERLAERTRIFDGA